MVEFVRSGVHANFTVIVSEDFKGSLSSGTDYQLSSAALAIIDCKKAPAVAMLLFLLKTYCNISEV